MARMEHQSRYVTSFEPGVRYRRWFRIGNAVMRVLLRSRLGSRMQGLAILTFSGRKTGTRYSVPVSVLELDRGPVVLTASPWKANLRGGADVDVRSGQVTRQMRASLIENPERVADVYEELLPRVGVAHAKRLGLVVAGERPPTRQELIEGIAGRRVLIELADR